MASSGPGGVPSTHGRSSVPAPEPWWGRRTPSESGLFSHLADGNRHREVLPAWNWLPAEGAAPRLDLMPWWARAWYHLPFIDHYAYV